MMMTDKNQGPSKGSMESNQINWSLVSAERVGLS